MILPQQNLLRNQKNYSKKIIKEHGNRGNDDEILITLVHFNIMDDFS